MRTLSKTEQSRRLVVIRDRLGETRHIRTMGMKPETAEVWMAIAKGYYGNYSVNVANVVEKTKMDKNTIMRHAKILAGAETPMITIRRRGQDTILRVTEESQHDPRVVAYYHYRYQALRDHCAALEALPRELSE